MLITQFILQNFHFGLNLFAALVFFAVFWLYFDAWKQTKKIKDLFKVLGFLFLSVSFLVHSTFVEQTVLNGLIFNSNLIENFANIFKLIAYILLILGLLSDPVQKKPGEAEKKLPAGFIFPVSMVLLNWIIIFPILSIFLFFLLLFRSTRGLENHLKPLTFGFLFIFLYDSFSLAKLFEKTTNINIYNLVHSFGPLWIITQVLLLAGVLIIAKWIFSYLLKRIQTQLFMIINVLVLIIFLATTVAFTGLLISNLQSDALSHLATDASVVQYAVNAKQEETLSDAQVVSQNTALQNAILANDRQILKTLSTSILLAKKQSYLEIADVNGVVLMRGEDNEKIGDSISSDSLFIKAMRGEGSSSVVVVNGAIAPTVSVRSSVPIVNNNKTIGVVIVGTDIDNTFVDGLKNSTKLKVSIYAGNILSASTFVTADGKSRFVGIKEEAPSIIKTVLNENKNYSSVVTVLNKSYLAVFAPLRDVNGVPVGMLFVGKDQVGVLQAAALSIEYTFIISAILILLSVIPAFIISKYIANQFK